MAKLASLGLSSLALAAAGALSLGGCGSDSGGGGSGGCPSLSGSWTVSGTCSATSCAIAASGCTLSLQCNDGNTYSGTLSGTSLTFSGGGASCSGTVGDLSPGKSPEAKGTCSLSGTTCSFDAQCGSGPCTSAGNTTVGSGGGCTSDANCPSGQGCKTETNGDNYCAPLCMTLDTCPTQNQCAGSTDAPKKECKEVGSHTGGNGVCDLYNGSYGAHTCNP